MFQLIIHAYWLLHFILTIKTVSRKIKTEKIIFGKNKTEWGGGGWFHRAPFKSVSENNWFYFLKFILS